jgi:hypothetical protein
VENQVNTSLAVAAAGTDAGPEVPESIKALASLSYETSTELAQAAAATCRAVARGDMALDHGVKWGSVLGRAIKAKEVQLRYGPFQR